MRTIRRPSHSTLAVFRDCYQGYVRQRTLHRRTRLENSEIQVQFAATDYDTQLQAGRPDLLAGMSTVGVATKEDLVDLYNSKFVPESSPGRDVYDALRDAAPGQLCPYCKQRNVSTLDHYLPKSSHPQFAVHTRNLVPSCYECNRVKLAAAPVAAADFPIHPYFDTPPKNWLVCRVVCDNALSVIFEANPALHQGVLTRVEAHMAAFGLGALYRVEAMRELTDSRGDFVQAGRVSAEALRLHCLGEFRNKKDLDRWRVALYRGLAESRDFLDGGFELIEDQ